MQADVDAGWKL